APIGHMSPVTALCLFLAGISFLAPHILDSRRRWPAAISFLCAVVVTPISLALALAYILGAPLLYSSGVIPPALPTSLAIFVLAAALLQPSAQRAWPSDRLPDAVGARASLALALIFVFLCTGIVTSGYLYVRHYERHHRAEVEHVLAAVVELKAAELARWRKERLREASAFFGNPRFSELARDVLADASAAGARREVSAWLLAGQASGRYARVSLLDDRGTELVVAPPVAGTAPLEVAREAVTVRSGGRATFVDLYRSAPDRPIRLGVLVPVQDGDDGHRILGSVALSIDPAVYLYPLIRRLPLPSDTAETMLVRRAGDDVQYLNDLRFRAGTALMLHRSRGEHDVFSVLLARPDVRIAEGIDYLGNSVLAVIRAVPESPWFLIARVDKVEVYAPARQHLWLVVGLVATLLLCAAAGVASLWRHQRDRFLRAQRKAHEAVAQSEATLRAMFAGIRDGIVAADQETGRLLAVNESICGMLGYSRSELLAMAVGDIYAAEPQQPAHEPMVTDISVRRKDGSTFFAEVTSAAVELGGRPCGLSVLRDVTDRRRAQARIVHLNVILRGLSGVNQLIMREKNRDRLIKQACELLVESRGFHAVLIGIVSPDTGRALAHASAGRELGVVNETLACGDVPACAQQAMEASGDVLVATGSAGPCASCYLRESLRGGEEILTCGLAQHGRRYGFILAILPEGLGGDPEERELLREVAGDIGFALRGMELEAERDRSLAALLSAEEQLRQAQKLEAVGQLAGGVAHDFNNLLTVILGYGDTLLLALPPAGPLRKHADAIVTAGERAAGLTRQLLAFSRKQTLRPEVLDLNDVVRNMQKMLRRLIGEDIDIATALATDLGMIKADPGQVEQVIINLAVNARDAMPHGGRLLIETANVEQTAEGLLPANDTVTGAGVLMAIADTGCGMSDETKSHLFEPFFTTKGQGRGTGLGLATVYGIVKQSGGNISVASEPERGTTFKIYFPRVELPPTSPTERFTTVVRGAGELVLVVEDEPALRDLFGSMLESLGYRSLVAADGEEALSAVNDGTLPDLLVTDVVMPGMSGPVLASRLRQSLPELKVLFMSGYTDSAIVHHGVLDPGVPLMQKPFSVSHLSVAIREILEARE
ncbi:MAG: response regulator, partial [Candidatus Schekmanbacteria bacterium]|nr:response regulator [Candidatus Schekmanbacteria bacterium]